MARSFDLRKLVFLLQHGERGDSLRRIGFCRFKESTVGDHLNDAADFLKRQQLLVIHIATDIAECADSGMRCDERSLG